MIPFSTNQSKSSRPKVVLHHSDPLAFRHQLQQGGLRGRWFSTRNGWIFGASKRWTSPIKTGEHRFQTVVFACFCFGNSGFYLEPLNTDNKMDCWFKTVGSVVLHCDVTLSSLQNRLAVWGKPNSAPVVDFLVLFSHQQNICFKTHPMFFSEQSVYNK